MKPAYSYRFFVKKIMTFNMDQNILIETKILERNGADFARMSLLYHSFVRYFWSILAISNLPRIFCRLGCFSSCYVELFILRSAIGAQIAINDTDQSITKKVTPVFYSKNILCIFQLEFVASDFQVAAVPLIF